MDFVPPAGPDRGDQIDPQAAAPPGPQPPPPAQHYPPPAAQPPPQTAAYAPQPYPAAAQPFGAAVYAQYAPPPGSISVDGLLLAPAGFGWRALAYLIDAVVLGILSKIMILAAGIPQPDTEAVMGQMMSLFTGNLSVDRLMELDAALRPPWYQGLILYFMYAGYFIFFHWLLGATLGKLALGLSVRLADGRPLDFTTAALRYVLYYLTKWMAYTAWLIPLDREKRTLYDTLLKTNVFRAR